MCVCVCMYVCVCVCVCVHVCVWGGGEVEGRVGVHVCVVFLVSAGLSGTAGLGFSVQAFCIVCMRYVFYCRVLLITLFLSILLHV